MGKKNEIIQWVLIGLLIVYAIALPIVLYRVGVYGLGMVVAGQALEKARDSTLENAKICETKEDCSFGSGDVVLDINSGLGFGILEVEEFGFDHLDGDRGTIEGCVNPENVEDFVELEFEGECSCISGQCGWIR